MVADLKRIVVFGSHVWPVCCLPSSFEFLQKEKEKQKLQFLLCSYRLISFQ